MNFVKLNNTLEGTFVYFEVNEECNNLPIIESHGYNI